jgi:hypothetical protein
VIVIVCQILQRPQEALCEPSLVSSSQISFVLLQVAVVLVPRPVPVFLKDAPDKRLKKHFKHLAVAAASVAASADEASPTIDRDRGGWRVLPGGASGAPFQSGMIWTLRG